jgi:four helix bundle protein
MQDYKKLVVWQKGHNLALSIYKVTQTFHHEEQFGLISQIRRAAVSVPSNIAEGCGRDGNTEFNRFLQYSLGSANEVEYYLMLSCELKYISLEDFELLNKQINETKSMIIALLKKLKT